MYGGDVVAEILKREGTEFLSCYPRNSLIESCARAGIRPILCRQERVGVGIADGYSRMHRGKKNGVFAVQQGPGIENAFPGVAQAYAENVPILILPAGTALSRQYMRPNFSAAEVYKPVTKWAARAHSPKELPDLMRRAYHAMRTGKPGPVLLEIPVEVIEAEFSGALDYEPVKPYRAAPDPAAVKEAVRLLLSAKNPILWAGQGVIYAEATDELVKLAELIPAPVMTTNPGKSAFPENHPLALGASTRSQPKMLVEFLKPADLVFAIGSSLTRTPFGPNVPAGKRIVHSTNDADDVNKDYRADHAVIGDSKLVLEALVEEVKRQKGGKASDNALGAMKESIASIKKAWLAEWSKHLDSNEVPMNQYRVIRDLMQNVDPKNVILTHDSGSPREQILPFWESAPGQYMGWGKSTQLGYGLGIIMGAKLAQPKKLCINIMGDSAIGMTGMDIETAARNRIPIMTIVFNNGVMAAERDVMLDSAKKYDTLLVSGNYAKVAEGLNVASIRVEKPDAIVPAIKEGIKTTESGRPFLLECVVKEGYDFSRYPLPGL